MVHAAAAAAARALARAIREYAKRRLIDHYLVEVADSAVAIPATRIHKPSLVQQHLQQHTHTYSAYNTTHTHTVW